MNRTVTRISVDYKYLKILFFLLSLGGSLSLSARTSKNINHMHCVMCGDRFLCGATKERVKITLFEERKKQTITDHCHTKNVRLSENIRVNKGPQSEAEGRHQKLSEIVDVMLVKRQGTKEKRFEQGFKLGEIKYYIHSNKTESKKVYSKLRKANMVLPIKSFGDYKLTMMPDRPIEEYRVYVHGLMTQDPYHLTNRGNGNNIYLFAVNPDGAVRKAGESFGGKVSQGNIAGSSSGGSGDSNANPGVVSVGKETSSKASKNRSKLNTDTRGTTNKLVMNDQAEWVVQKAPVNTGVTNVVSARKSRSPIIRGSDLPRRTQSRSVSSTNSESLLQDSESPTQQEKKKFKLKSIFTDEDRKLFNGVEVETDSSEQTDTPQVSVRSRRSRRTVSSSSGSSKSRPTPSVGETDVGDSIVLPEFKGPEIDVSVPAINIDKGGEKSPAVNKSPGVVDHRTSGNVNCDSIREHIVSNYKNRQFCGVTLEKYSFCERNFRKKILTRCEKLFHGSYPVEEDQYWVDQGKGIMTSIQRCSQRLEQMTEVYMPKPKDGQIKTNLISSFYEFDASERINLNIWQKVKKRAQRKKRSKFSDVYCSTDVQIQKRIKDDLNGIEKLIEIKIGTKIKINSSNCKELIDTYLPKLMTKYERLSPKELKATISDSVLFYGGLNYVEVDGKRIHPSALKGPRREIEANRVYEQSKALYNDLKLFMARYELKNFINPMMDEEIGVVHVIEGKIEQNVGKRCSPDQGKGVPIKTN